MSNLCHSFVVCAVMATALSTTAPADTKSWFHTIRAPGTPATVEIAASPATPQPRTGFNLSLRRDVTRHDIGPRFAPSAQLVAPPPPRRVETTDDGYELPAIWTHIRSAVRKTEETLPHHRKAGFYVVGGLVVVSNGFDRVAGVGAQGYF